MIDIPSWLSFDDKLALIDAIELELDKLKESEAKEVLLDSLEELKVELTALRAIQRSVMILKPARMDFSSHEMR